MAALSEAMSWLLGTADMFAHDKFHGNITWKPMAIVFQAICWAFQESRNVTDAFAQSLSFCNTLQMTGTAKTYPRFISALATYTCLKNRMRARIQYLAKSIAGRFWEDKIWVLFAFDGSRVSTPRTLSNELAFCAENYGQGKTAKYRKKKTKGMRRTQNEKNKPQPPRPQIWMTAIWHMGLRLTWSWRLGRSNASERAHVEEMIHDEEFPKNSLFCGDAGFVGYPFWNKILFSGMNFLVRVGANVSLLSDIVDVERIKDNQVLCWPKGQMQKGGKPLRLRLVRIKIGKSKMWMLTSVLERHQLSIADMTRYYKMRWGIEIQYRGLKQTLNKRDLRCRNSGNAIAELDWSILGMISMELLALREQLSHTNKNSPNYRPVERSLAESARAIRKCMLEPFQTPPAKAGLADMLKRALVQTYRNRTGKRARYRPPNPDKKPLGNPQLTKINNSHRKRIETIAKLAA
jgi:hypothetical protein